MKIDLKLIFLLLIVVVLVCEIDGWGRGSRRRSSRSPSRRGGSWGSRRRSSSGSRRRAVSARRRAVSSRRRSSWSSRRRAVSARRRSSWASRRRGARKPVTSRRRSSWASRRRGARKPVTSRRRSGLWGSRRRGSVPSTSRRRSSGFWSRPSKPKAKIPRVTYPTNVNSKTKKKFLKSKIVSVKQVERPLSPLSKIHNVGPKNHKIKHTGVVVTTANGKKYMIEKSVYGKGKPNVKITPVGKNGIGGQWHVTKGKGTKKVKNKNMKSFVDATKPGYSVIGNNCQTTSDKLYQLGKRGRCG